MADFGMVESSVHELHDAAEVGHRRRSDSTVQPLPDDDSQQRRLLRSTSSSPSSSPPPGKQKDDEGRDGDGDGARQHCAGARRAPRQLYARRWLVLLSFSLLTMSNSWMWITWSPIEAHVAALWNVTDVEIDALSTVFMYTYVPLSFPALWLLNRIGMRWGLVLGAAINTAGAAVRWLGWRTYAWVYLGTLLCSAAQTFTLAVPPLLSGSWFGFEERALATSLGVLANQMGTAAGLGSTIAIDMTSSSSSSSSRTFSSSGSSNRSSTTRADSTGSTSSTGSTGSTGTGIGTSITDTTMASARLPFEVLPLYLGVQCAVAGAALLLVLVFVRDAPPTPASNAAAEAAVDPPGYLPSLRAVICRRSGLLLVVVYGFSVGVFYAYATFLSQLLPSWSSSDHGWLGITLVLSGVAGSGLASWLLDRTRKHREISNAVMIGSVISGLGFSLTVWKAPHSGVAVFLTIGAVGFFLTALLSIGMEFATALAYPADEAVVTGVLNAAAQTGGCILVWSGGALLASPGMKGDEALGVSVLNAVLVITLALAGILLALGVRGTSQRPTD